MRRAPYQTVFEKLHGLLQQFEPTQVIADFEDVPATAARAVFGVEVTVSIRVGFIMSKTNLVVIIMARH